MKHFCKLLPKSKPGIENFAEIVRRPAKKQNIAKQPVLLVKRPIPQLKSKPKTQRALEPVPVRTIDSKMPIPLPSKENPNQPILKGRRNPRREPLEPTPLPRIDSKMPIPVPTKENPNQPTLLGHKRPKTALSEQSTEILTAPVIEEKKEAANPANPFKKGSRKWKRREKQLAAQAKKEEKEKKKEAGVKPSVKHTYSLGPGLLDLLHELTRKR